MDAFKDAIHASLSEYNEQIEALKTEMADAMRIADALRCGFIAHVLLMRPCLL